MKKTEHDIQCSVVKWFDLQYKQYAGRLLAIPNGGFRHITTAKRLKAEGVRSGVPDLMLPVPSKGYHGLFIEMKAPCGKATQSQKDWMLFLQQQGYRVELCYSLEDAINTIGEYFS